MIIFIDRKHGMKSWYTSCGPPLWLPFLSSGLCV